MQNEIYFCKSSVSKIFVRTAKNPCNEKIILENKDGLIFCLKHKSWEKCKSIKVEPETAEITAEFECGNTEKGFFANSNVISYRVKINENEYCPLIIEKNIIDEKRFVDFQKNKIPFKEIPTKKIQLCYGKGSLVNNLRNGREFEIMEHKKKSEGAGLETVKIYAENFLWNYEKDKMNLSGKKPIKPEFENMNYWLDSLASFPCEPGITELFNIVPETKNIRSDDKNAWFSLCNLLGIKSFPALHKIFRKNPKSIISYKNILYCGFKDLNIIEEMLSDDSCRLVFSDDDFFEKYSEYRTTEKDLKFFFEKALEKRTEKSVWNTIKRNIKTYIQNQNEGEPENYYLQNIYNSLHSSKILGQRLDDNFSKSYDNKINMLNIIEENEISDSNYKINFFNDYNSYTNERYIYDFFDAARMFKMYYDFLPEELVHSVIYDGLSRYNHDALSKHNPQQKNVTFKYSEAELSLEDSVLDYDFYLPKESAELINLGSTLHNCVGSYAESVLAKECTIVAAKQDNFPVLCIEVRNLSTVNQVRANFNSRPSEKQKEAFDIWCKRHKLSYI